MVDCGFKWRSTPKRDSHIHECGLHKGHGYDVAPMAAYHHCRNCGDEISASNPHNKILNPHTVVVDDPIGRLFGA